MVEWIAFMVVAHVVTFLVGFFFGRKARYQRKRVRVPDYVPTDWKISKGEG